MKNRFGILYSGTEEFARFRSFTCEDSYGGRKFIELYGYDFINLQKLTYEARKLKAIYVEQEDALPAKVIEDFGYVVISSVTTSQLGQDITVLKCPPPKSNAKKAFERSSALNSIIRQRAKMLL